MTEVLRLLFTITLYTGMKADEFLMNRYSMGKISGKISIVTNDVSNSFVSQIQITTPKNEQEQHIFQHFHFPLLIS